MRYITLLPILFAMSVQAQAFTYSNGADTIRVVQKWPYGQVVMKDTTYTDDLQTRQRPRAHGYKIILFDQKLVVKYDAGTKLVYTRCE